MLHDRLVGGMSKLQPDADGGEDVPRIVSRDALPCELEAGRKTHDEPVPVCRDPLVVPPESRQGDIRRKEELSPLDGKEGHLVEMLADDVDEDRRGVSSPGIRWACIGCQRRESPLAR
ncbi:MAG TPA: hypothetical protein DD658_00105 [Deltaproteobacteria bacterium]|nr:hypothetical protein [Deltaproteobacteria bacterium]